MRWLVALAVATMALAFSATALAAHSWSDHHWLVKSAPRELTVKESVGDAYSPDAVWADWAGQSGQFLTFAHTSGRKANITMRMAIV